jgi:peptide/nickel transport system permease protein
MSSGPLIVGAGEAPALRPQGPIERSRDGSSQRAMRAMRALLADRRIAVPFAVIVALVLFAIFAPILWDYGPDKQDLLHSLESPSFSHPMGTDQLGRDMFARVADGARISLIVATLVTVAGALLGGLIGLLAGTIGGISDGVVMRAMDAILAFPPLILAMAVTVGLGIGLNTAAIGVALVSVPWYARLLRSEALRIRSLPFIEASYAIGMKRSRVIARHVIPHMLPVLFIQMAAAFGYAVLGLASLSFVGLGAQVPTPEWGALITEGLSYSLTGQWWISIFPGVALLITVTAASMLSDRMRDLLDPRGEYARL